MTSSGAINPELRKALAGDEVALAALARLEAALDEKISVSTADDWLSHRFHQVCDERDALIAACRPVVEQYGRVWAKDTSYYAAAELLDIYEPLPDDPAWPEHYGEAHV